MYKHYIEENASNIKLVSIKLTKKVENGVEILLDIDGPILIRKMIKEERHHIISFMAWSTMGGSSNSIMLTWMDDRLFDQFIFPLELYAVYKDSGKKSIGKYFIFHFIITTFSQKRGETHETSDSYGSHANFV